GAHARRSEPALRRLTDRPADVRRRHRHVAARGSLRVLAAGAASRARSSDGGPAIRMKTPNTKHQRSLNSQAPMRRYRSVLWRLELGFSLELGVWFLVFCTLVNRKSKIVLISLTEYV